MKLRTVALSLLLVGALCAQGKGDPVTRRLNMLTRFLGLSSSQQSAVEMILTTEETAIQAASATIKTDRGNLATAIKNNDQGGIKTYTMQLSQDEQPVQEARAIAAAAIYAQLMPDQKMKLGNGLGILLDGGGPGFGRGRGPGGPPPGN